MGYGDSIMATGEARLLHERTGLRVAIGDGRKLRWDGEVFAHNPRLATAETVARAPVAWLAHYPGCRPYIDHEAVARRGGDKHAARWIWRPEHRAVPGEIWFDRLEQEAVERHRAAGPYVLIEPTIKAKAAPGKDWGWARWTDLARRLAANGVRLRQVGAAITPFVLSTAAFVRTLRFREALTVLAAARLYVGPEGGLHHAAAALGVPAVVLFGGYISPAITGYDSHVNFYAGGEPCGSRRPCAHCDAAMAAIDPAAVAAAALTLWTKE